MVGIREGAAGEWVRRIARIMHEADLNAERYDAPEAAGLDAALPGLSTICDDRKVLQLTGLFFDGLYEFYRLVLVTGREPT
jgi:hypothetical protein